MADDLDQLLSSRAAAADSDDLDALLTSRAATETPKASRFHEPTAAELKSLADWNKPQEGQKWYDRVAHRSNDVFVGLGQIAQHVIPDAALNAGRKVTDPIVNAVMGGDVSTSNTSAADFDAGVRRNEQGYQADRAAAGQTGFDWAGLTGTLVNPVSWLGPSGSGTGVMAGIANGVKQGAFQALLQPVTSKGSFVYDKTLQGTIGGLVGGTLGGALAALRPVFGKAKDAFGGLFKGADEPTQAAAATKITEDTLKAAGADPAKIDPNLYSAMKQEVGDALKVGAEPNPQIMANRADAASLPVPMRLTRGMASGDPMQYSWEQNTAKLRGVGEDLNARISELNRAAIANLNQLGAKNAPSTFDTSKKLIEHIEGLDKKAQDAVSDAYNAVRDSAGRPARVSNEDFANISKNLLTEGRPELAGLTSLADYLPEPIAKTYNAIISGKLPLTVDTVQFLDRAWGGVQRGGGDKTSKEAIGHLRTALNEAPVSDALGEESMAAYKAAKSLAKQRFDMIKQIPAYKAVDSGVEPDKFFQKYVQGANVSELAGLKNLVGPDNTLMLRNTFLGNLKRVALNKKSDERGVFSQAAYNGVLQDPVQGPRIQELFKEAPETLGHLYRLGRAAENVWSFPAGHGVNVSNTAPTAANFVRDMVGSDAVSSFLDRVPVVKGLRYLSKEATEKAAARKAVYEAVNPGVTSSALKPAPPSPQVRKLSDLLLRGAGGGTAAALSSDDE